MLLAYRLGDRPTRARAVALGFSCGFIAITHAEQLLLVGILLVPLMLLARGTPLRRRVGWAALATAAAAVVILPWAVYDTARFDSPVLLGTEFGITDLRCQSVAARSGRIKGRDTVTRDGQYLRVGVDYARGFVAYWMLVEISTGGSTRDRGGGPSRRG